MSKLKRHKEHAKARISPLETLVDELLLGILDHIGSKQDLLNVCLVSRRLYSLTIEVLFRDLSLDLSAASHRRLLRRLVHPKAYLPRRIQTLRVTTSWWDLSLKHATNVFALFHLMTNLKFFEWTGPFWALCNIPDVFHTRFPKAIMEVKDNDFSLFDPDSEDESEHEELPITTALTHPVQSQITQITLILSSFDGAYANFKRDLVEFLNNNRVLRHISIRLRDGVSFPSYVAGFENGELPKPAVLDLGNTKEAVFSPQELKRWGKQGGWDRLTSLETGSMDCFRCFVGHGVGLKKLTLYTTDDEDNELDMIDHILASADIPVPFPDLWYFSCVERDVEFRPNLRFMPVNILRWMPTLTYLMLVHDENCWHPGFNPELPSSEHVKDIRQSCPNLEHLVIEMGLTKELPLDLIKELARFVKPIKLNIFACRPVNEHVRARWRAYWRIAREMYHERKRLGLKWGRPFAVKFTTVGQHDEMPIDKVDSPDVYFENFKTRFGELTIPQFVGDDSLAGASHMLDRMSDRDLELLQYNIVFGYPVWKRRHITQEIKRREEDEHTMLADDEYPTLYDAMIQQNN